MEMSTPSHSAMWSRTLACVVLPDKEERGIREELPSPFKERVGGV